MSREKWLVLCIQVVWTESSEWCELLLDERKRAVDGDECSWSLDRVMRCDDVTKMQVMLCAEMVQ